MKLLSVKLLRQKPFLKPPLGARPNKGTKPDMALALRY